MCTDQNSLHVTFKNVNISIKQSSLKIKYLSSLYSIEIMFIDRQEKNHTKCSMSLPNIISNIKWRVASEKDISLNIINLFWGKQNQIGTITDSVDIL